MLSSPIIIFYSFMVLVVFVIGVAPSAVWKRFGASGSGVAARARHDRMAAHFRRATAAAEFSADVDYVPLGIGFAFDRARGLLFVAGAQAGRPAEALVALAALRAYASGVVTGGFTDDNYVELFPADAALPSWRISCGEDVASVTAIDRLLGTLGLPKV